MNLADLTQFVCTKGQMVGTADIAAAKLFLAKRYELIWNSYLWKDSLVMVDVAVSPDDANNAEGIVLMPEIIDRVVAIRTGDRSVKVNGLETFYREDFDKFAELGTPYEFAILSPVWFIWRGGYGLQLTSADGADDGKKVKVSWQDSANVRHTDSITLNTANPPVINDTFRATLKVTGAGRAACNGTYTWNDGTGQYVNDDGGSTIQQQAGLWVMLEGITKRYLVPDSGGVSDTWIDGSGGQTNLPVPTVVYNPPQRLTVENVFSETLSGALSLSPRQDGDDDGGTMAAGITKSPSYQRVRLFYIPSVAMTLKVLGKRKCSALNFDHEEPEIRNLENCLIAFALGDLWARRRQMGKASQFYQEGTALLKELAKLETMQAAHNSRFIPDAGAGDPFFGPGRSAGFWI